MGSDILSGIWPEWQAVKKLGQGSYGTVYEAVRRDHNMESRAAIKVISIPQNESEIASLRSEGLTMDNAATYLKGIVDDFAGEIRLMESLKGIQNIVSVEDYKVVEKHGTLGFDIYIRMELLTPFNEFLCNRVLTEKEVIKLGCDICNALEFCEKSNVIHRDIKPENIFLNSFGDYKLGDFGIARTLENATGGLSRKGTYFYIAPEVEKGMDYDKRADLYSLGLVLYRLMNRNCLPFLNAAQLMNPNERMAAVKRRLDGEPLPTPSDASSGMAKVIRTACEYEPGKRYASASEMRKALMGVTGVTVNLKKESAGGEDTKSKPKGGLDETVSVRRASPEQPEKEVGTFGAKEKPGRTKFIAIALAAVVVVGAAAFAGTRLAGGGSDTDDSQEAVSGDDSRKMETDEPVEADGSDQEDNAAVIGDVSVPDADIIADGPVYINGYTKIAVDGGLFVDWESPNSIKLTQADGSKVILDSVSTAYLNNNGVSDELWNLLPYDAPLQFEGTLRLSGSRLVMDVTNMTDVNGGQIVVQPKTAVTTPVPQNPEPIIEEADVQILPQSATRLLTKSDISGMSLREINYAKNEIYARHGRLFQSRELQNYFNDQSWYVGSIAPENFRESMLSNVEKQNADFLASVEFSIAPNGYQLDAY